MTSAPTASSPTTSTTATLAEARARNESTWRAAATALYAGDIETFLEHWTESPRYEVAYPISGFPSVVQGTDEFRMLFGSFTAAAERISVDDVTFHQTDDPDVVIVEERMRAELRDGHQYENRMIIRVRFRQDRIDDMVEYYGQVAHQGLADRLLAAAAAAGSGVAPG